MLEILETVLFILIGGIILGLISAWLDSPTRGTNKEIERWEKRKPHLKERKVNHKKKKKKKKLTANTFYNKRNHSFQGRSFFMSFGLSKYYAEKEVTEYMKSDYYWDFYYKGYVWKMVDYYRLSYEAICRLLGTNITEEKKWSHGAEKTSPYQFSMAVDNEGFEFKLRIRQLSSVLEKISELEEGKERRELIDAIANELLAANPVSAKKQKEISTLFNLFPKLKGINFGKVKFGTSGNSAKEVFASDIDGDWHYRQNQMVMLFKAFSKKKYKKEIKYLLYANGITNKEKVEETESLAEYWIGNGFKIEHPVLEGIDIIIITNESAIPKSSFSLQKTKLAPKVDLPSGYENIGIESVYDGDKFLKANNGQLSLNIPLLFKDPTDGQNYILIGASTLTVAKHIINDIIDKNYGIHNFNKLDEKEGWEYTYANKFFAIGFMTKYYCVRINMLHNLVKLS